MWLSMVTCPSSFSAGACRYSLIVPASRLAQGERLSLAPRVLADIYKGLGELALSEKSPMETDVYFAAHFFFAWLGLYFPWVYKAKEDAGIRGNKIRLWYFCNRKISISEWS